MGKKHTVIKQTAGHQHRVSINAIKAWAQMNEGKVAFVAAITLALGSFGASAQSPHYTAADLGAIGNSIAFNNAGIVVRSELDTPFVYEAGNLTYLSIRGAARDI